MARLKPCPFCGGKPKLFRTNFFAGDNAWAVECRNEDCRMHPHTPRCDEARLAIVIWNKRVGDANEVHPDAPSETGD